MIFKTLFTLVGSVCAVPSSLRNGSDNYGSRSLAALGASANGGRDLFTYVDNWNGMTANQFSIDMATQYSRGVNYVMFAFYCAASGQPLGPFDTVLAWQGFSNSDKSAIISAKNSAGAKFVMSMGGGTDTTWFNMDATQYSNQACKFAVAQQFDGVDFDMENQDPNDKGALNWLVTATKNCAAQGVHWISHAPQAPHLSTTNYGEAYLYVLKNTNNLINKFLIQYYNQGSWAPYTTYDSIFTKDSSWGASISELKMAAPGYDSVFVVGKILLPEDGTDGYVPTHTLSDWVCRAEKELGYSNGLMFWQHQMGRASETATVYAGLTQSCASGSTNAPTYAPTSAPTTASTQAPTPAPTTASTKAPTSAPTTASTKAPTTASTKAPTPAPTTASTKAPTPAPTTASTKAPTPAPTTASTKAPTSAASTGSTYASTKLPTTTPNQVPTPSTGCYAPTSWDWQAATCAACAQTSGDQCASSDHTTCYPSMSLCCAGCIKDGYCTSATCSA